MRNTKEIKTILSVLYYLNRLGANDKDIDKLLNYAFYRIFDSNTNLLMLACIGITKEAAMPEINKILEQDTQYHQYITNMEARKNGNS